MKKTCFVLLCAALFAFAPVAMADDGAGFSLDGLLDSLVAVFSSLLEDPEMGVQCPPGGQSAVGVSGAANTSQNNGSHMGEQVEMGWQIEPFG